MRRLWPVIVAGVAVLGGCADYEGEVHEQVVRSWDVEFVDVLPEGFRIIGDVTLSGTCTCTTGDTDLLQAIAELAACSDDLRLERRMRRAAAQNGGELLVDVHCVSDTTESTYTTLDDDGTWVSVDEKTVDTTCIADVARRTDH